MPEHIPNWFQKFGYGEFIHLEHHKPCCARMIKGDKVFREVEQNCWDSGVRLKEMDETEVTMQRTVLPLPGDRAAPDAADDGGVAPASPTG